MTRMDLVPNAIGPSPAAPLRPSLAARLAGRCAELSQRRGAAVLMDQAIVSLGNFLTVALLGRHLLKPQFGAYGMLMETLFFLNSLQGALVIYPLTICGATGDHRSLSRLTTASLLFTVVMLPVLGGAMALSAVLAGQTFVAITVTVSMLLWQLQETLRRSLMAELRFSAAVWGDAISYLGQAGVIFLLWRLGWLNLANAFLGIAATSLLAGAVQAIQVGLVRVGWRDLLALAPDFWRRGRWMMLASGTVLITTLGYFWTLRFSHGLVAVGAFTAIVGMMKLANPVMSSTSSLVLPTVAKAYKEHGFAAARRIAVRYGLFGALLLTPFFLFLLLLPSFGLRLMYQERYLDLAGPLRLFVANYALLYVSIWVGAWVNGLGESRANFYAQGANAIVTLLIGLPLTCWLGVPGVIVGGLIATASGVVACLYLLGRVARRHEPVPDAPSPVGPSPTQTERTSS